MCHERIKVSDTGPCETLRAHRIPCENPEGKSRDLQSMFPFLLQLLDRTEHLHFRIYSVSNILYKHRSHNNLLRN